MSVPVHQSFRPSANVRPFALYWPGDPRPPYVEMPIDFVPEYPLTPCWYVRTADGPVYASAAAAASTAAGVSSPPEPPPPPHPIASTITRQEKRIYLHVERGRRVGQDGSSRRSVTASDRR